MVSPLSPMTGLRGERTDFVGSALAGRQAYEQSQLNQQALRQGQQNIDAADREKSIQKITVMKRLAEKARSLPPEQRYSFVNSINPEMLRSVGIDPADIPKQQLDDASLDQLIAQASSYLPETKATGEAASFNEMTSGLSGDEREKARRIALGLDPRAQGSASQTIADRGLTSSVGASEAEIARQKALATGGVDLGIKPEISRRQAQAEADVELSTKPSITAATTTADINAKSGAEAKSALPKVEAAADRSIGLIDELLTHPGRDLATGKTAFLPAIPGTKQGDFINRFDQVKGQSFLQAFESLKGAGAITDQEGKAATQAFARLNRATSRAEFDDAAEELKGAIESLRDIAKSKASQGGSGKGGSTPGINSNTPDTVSWDSLK